MFRNYLAAASRNLVRNRLYAAINIIGLAVGLSAALLIALYVRDELSYDKWMPGHQRTYAVLMRATTGDAAPTEWDTTVINMAQLLRLDFPSIEAVARLRMTTSVSLRRGEIDLADTVYSADPELFSVLPLKAIAGNLATALNDPNSIVLTRSMARKYFGRDDVLGETIELNHKYPLRVTAVLDDLPSNTHLNTEIIISGRASFSELGVLDARPPVTPDQGVNVLAAYTYIRLKPGASIDELRLATPAFVARHLQDVVRTGLTRRQEPVFVPITELHLARFGNNPMKPPGDLAAIKALAVIGGIIISLAAINFVNLMTARAHRRAAEVGIRKVSGAKHRDLVIQFLGETLIYVVLCMMMAIALIELLLPATDAFLQRTIVVHFFGDIPLMSTLAGLTIIISLLAGFYPAFVLSAFRPATVLKGGKIHELRSTSRMRQVLVALQFAILIGLTASAGVVYRQTHYAMNEALRLDKDQVLLIRTACRSAFKDEVSKLSGVQAVACSDPAPLKHLAFSRVPRASGPDVDVTIDSVDFGFFELYGLQPIAGRFFARNYGKDTVLPGQNDANPNIVINETAAVKFGFTSPSEAVGKSISFGRFEADSPGRVTARLPAEIIGVVSDFPSGSINVPIMPTIFYVDPGFFSNLQVKLRGQDLPETLRLINQLWARYSDGYPPTFTFLDQRVQEIYLGIAREGQLLAVFAIVSIFVASLGLFGLAAFTADRRTNEIGIRKALGASQADILKLLLWGFAKPVLWANVIAWPVGYAVMHHWLGSFAYHIDLSPWIFLVASALALIIAVLTVGGHALLVSRAQPGIALRYE